MEKLVIYVCVGSSCHLKGSHTIVKLMKKAIADHNLVDKVELKATFCLGHCTDGPSVKVGDEVLYGKYSGTEIAIDGTNYLIMRESDIYAIV